MKKSIGAKTILYPAPVLILGTFDKGGRPNAMTAAWGGIWLFHNRLQFLFSG
ncbi:MAG: hypothetical protein RBR67_18380 [Desulfobacterium sp.]|jgi:flavin reductase (DIM6/NTAB) family NADH-FMN oxidoreductase RutF|nr:hypothetical protein [Desulfobacterium sp.]